MTTTRRDALGMTATAGVVLSVAACGGEDDGGSSGGGTSVRIPVADVPSEGGLVQEGVVVIRAGEEEFTAFDAECPHQGCSVNEVTSRGIICPCHGSEFDPASGEVTQGPAEEGLATRTATVEGDEIVIS